MIKKSRIIVIKDTCKGLIYKYSYKDSIREIQNNYAALKRVKKLSSPKYTCFITGEVGVLSVEELISGKEIILSNLNPNIYSDTIFRNICTTLQDYHSQTLKQVKSSIISEINQYDFLVDEGNLSTFNEIKKKLLFLYKLKDEVIVTKAQIHGDITYRNILVNNQKLIFIDFERASFDFPEFDYLNFILDFNVHASKKTSYRNYIDYLVRIYIENFFLNIFKGLEESNNFQSENTGILKLIYLKYLIRQIAIVTNVSNYQRDVDIDLIYTSISQMIKSKSD